MPGKAPDAHVHIRTGRLYFLIESQSPAHTATFAAHGISMTMTYQWLEKSLDDMIQFAEWHALPHVAGVLVRARSRIRDHMKIPSQPQDYIAEECPLRDVLDDLIDYCRQNRMDEVVDHLLEAQMAWAETHPAFGDNVIRFPTPMGGRGDLE